MIDFQKQKCDQLSECKANFQRAYHIKKQPCLDTNQICHQHSRQLLFLENLIKWVCDQSSLSFFVPGIFTNMLFKYDLIKRGGGMALANKYPIPLQKGGAGKGRNLLMRYLNSLQWKGFIAGSCSKPKTSTKVQPRKKCQNVNQNFCLTYQVGVY